MAVAKNTEASQATTMVRLMSDALHFGGISRPNLRRIVALAVCSSVVGIVLEPAYSDEPVSSSVTFNREIIRIFDRKCLPCHAPDGVAMSLAAYHEARPWARAIREELIEQRMPPWRAAPGYAALANDIGLSARELAMILTWADGGAPRGDDRDLPASRNPARNSPRSTNDSPDLTLPLPAQRVPAGSGNTVRRVTIDAGAVAGRWVRQVEIVPGNRRVMRAAFVWVLPREREHARWVGAWTPWFAAASPPEGAAQFVPPGASFVIDFHYRGRDRDLEDRSSLAITLAARGAPAAGQLVLRDRPEPRADRHMRRRGGMILQRDTTLWAILPEAFDPRAHHLESITPVGSLEVTARRPDGSVEVLLWIPDRRDAWPTPYILSTPLRLAAGTLVTVTAAGSRELGRGPSPAGVTLAVYETRRQTRAAGNGLSVFTSSPTTRRPR
ncbi:MAG TPA: cytochrome c [Vicinamibacterales bacterium]|nr:cytochrome c [Vicinamibacterales bacterium]